MKYKVTLALLTLLAVIGLSVSLPWPRVEDVAVGGDTPDYVTPQDVDTFLSQRPAGMPQRVKWNSIPSDEVLTTLTAHPDVVDFAQQTLDLISAQENEHYAQNGMYIPLGPVDFSLASTGLTGFWSVVPAIQTGNKAGYDIAVTAVLLTGERYERIFNVGNTVKRNAWVKTQ